VEGVCNFSLSPQSRTVSGPAPLLLLEMCNAQSDLSNPLYNSQGPLMALATLTTFYWPHKLTILPSFLLPFLYKVSLCSPGTGVGRCRTHYVAKAGLELTIPCLCLPSVVLEVRTTIPGQQTFLASLCAGESRACRLRGRPAV
jgi:hypothetical protein